MVTARHALAALAFFSAATSAAPTADTGAVSVQARQCTSDPNGSSGSCGPSPDPPSVKRQCTDDPNGSSGSCTGASPDPPSAKRQCTDDPNGSSGSCGPSADPPSAKRQCDGTTACEPSGDPPAKRADNLWTVSGYSCGGSSPAGCTYSFSVTGAGMDVSCAGASTYPAPGPKPCTAKSGSATADGATSVVASVGSDVNKVATQVVTVSMARTVQSECMLYNYTATHDVQVGNGPMATTFDMTVGEPLKTPVPGCMHTMDMA